MDEPKYIHLGDCYWAIVDDDYYSTLMRFRWRWHKRKRSVYAYTLIDTSPRTFRLFMHRLVSHCPANMIVHHKNGNSLDNRRCNLQPMVRSDHKMLHANNPIKYIYEKTTRKKTL